MDLQDADKKGLAKIAEEVKHLAQKAKENSLKPEDYEVGILSITVRKLSWMPFKKKKKPFMDACVTM